MKIILLEKLISETGSPGRVSRPRKNTSMRLPGPVAPQKKKKNSSGGGRGSARARVIGVLRGSSEVVVKISGFSKGGAHAKANLTYIARHGEIALENERGEQLTGRDELKELARDWSSDIEDHRRGKNQRDTMHLILSAPGTADPVALHNATRRFAQDTFSNHEYVFALHTDTDNHHCHLTIKCRGFDGKQLHVAKGEPQQWREAFAARLRAEGVEAEATPRQARGVTRKADRQVLRHIDDPAPQGRAPRTSRARRQQFEEALADFQAEQRGVKPVERHWEAASRARHTQIKQAWEKAAQALESTPDTPDSSRNLKEPSHERPIYRGIDGRTARVGQLHAATRTRGGRPSADRSGAGGGRGGRRRGRSAAVREPGAHAGRGAGRTPVARPNASVRDMPGSDVVHDYGGSEMLLLPDARHDVGNRRETGAHHAMRRPRAGLDADGRGHGQREQLSNAELAAQMRRFAANMPEPVTQYERIKAHLHSRAAELERRGRTQAPPASQQPTRPGPADKGPTR